MSLAISVKGLNKSFTGDVFKKNHQILKNLSFEVELGKTTGFVGVNGAGKTTTLKCLLGFIGPQSGAISILGENLSSEIKAKIGYLPERPYYYEFLTAKEFLRFHWELSSSFYPGTDNFEARAKEVLGLVNLPDVWDHRLRSFSKGMLQRIGIAQALLRKPELLILDEPMSGLDPDGRILIKDIIKREKQRNATIFFSSHLLGDMEELCDNLVVIDRGELAYQGSLMEFSKGKGIEESFRQLRQQLGAKSQTEKGQGL